MRAYLWIKNEIVRGAAIFFFFLITLSVINLTERLLLKTVGFSFSFLEILLVTFLITKIILVLEHLPVVTFLPERPIIFRIIGKSIVYWLITFFIRQATKFFGYFKESGWDWDAGWNSYVGQLDINLLIAVHSWFFMLLVLFITANELILIIGPARMRQIFFGKF